MRPIVALSALAAVLASNPARGQDDRRGSQVPILVTGAGLEAPPATPVYDVQVIERDRLTATASGRVEDALALVAGFQQFRRSDSRSSNPSAQGVTLRALGGNATSRALVLLDAVPVADPFFGYIPFNAIAPERLASARVTRGGGAGAFGAGAVAGTIELTSADAATLGPVSGRALVDDRGETELSATLAPRLGAGYAVASVRWDRGQGFWTTPADQRVPASARARYDAWSVSLQGVAPLAPDVELQARAVLFDDRRTLRFAGADSSSRGQDASVRVVSRGRWQFDALAYVQARDFSNVVVSATSFRPVLDQRATPSTGLGGKLELRPPLPAGHVLRLGADWRHAAGETREEVLSAATGAVTLRRRAGGRTSDLGLFTEYDRSAGPLALTVGARADRWAVSNGRRTETAGSGAPIVDQRFADRAGWDASLRAGAALDLSDGLRLRAAAYSGIRVPTLNELYRPFAVFPVTTRANADLRTERLRGFEAGAEWAPSPAFSAGVTLFDNRLERAIANVTLTPTLRERRNVDAVRARGIEATATIRLGSLSLDSSLALTDAEIEASGQSAALDGKRPAQTPRVAAAASLAWAPLNGWRLAATLRYTGAQFEDDLESERLPAATTLDGYFRMPLAGRFALVLRAENVFAEKVITRNQGGSIDLGTPRTLWAGIAVGAP